MKNLPIIRQGDVLLNPVAELPADCTEVPLDRGRIVLAYGEVTGHAHAIADHSTQLDHATEARAEEMAQALIGRAASTARARLFQAPNGERYLKVTEPVTLRHEEHTAHTLAPGVYQVPRQVEYTPAELRRVAD